MLRTCWASAPFGSVYGKVHRKGEIRLWVVRDRLHTEVTMGWTTSGEVSHQQPHHVVRLLILPPFELFHLFTQGQLSA